MGLPGGSNCKEAACNVGDLGSIPGLGRSPGKGNGYQFQYSFLENPMDGGTWRVTVHGLQRVVRDCMTKHTHTHIVNNIPQDPHRIIF